MKHEIVANSCRICLTQTKKLRSLYKPIDEGDESPNEMLHVITGIQVEKLEEHKTLPKNICKNCELSLNMAFEFRENALKTQKIIVEYLKDLYQNVERNEEEESNRSPRINYKREYEEIMNLEPLDCVDVLDEDMQVLNNEVHKSCVENEGELNVTASDEENESLNHGDQELYKQQEHLEILKEQDDQSGERNEEEINQSISYDLEDKEEQVVYRDQVEIMSTKRSKSTKSNRKKVSKMYTKPNKTTGKLSDYNAVNNMKLIPRRGRTATNVNNQTGHICDICGNVFTKLGRMMEHRQRHDKELRYSCEICDQKFLTRELLRKHMFSHSGGKPLKCKYCSRTFYYESVRRAHEAVHQGHKPYVCDVCDKAFGYAHALKKHKLIHDEIKLYRCDYCNKDFRLPHHMKQHEMTKLHQNAVRFANADTIYEDCSEFMRGEQDLNDDILFIEEIVDDQIASGS